MENNILINKESLPLIMSIHELQSVGISRTMAYQLFNRADFPVLKIGGRKFVARDKFFEWLDKQSDVSGK